MASTGAVGLLAIFGVDLLNLFYISLLGHQSIAAAIGFAGTVSFFQTSLSIGMTIGVAAVVSREIGAGRRAASRRIAGASLALMMVSLAAVGVATVLLLDPIMDVLGAEGETRRLAINYLTLTSLSVPLLAAGMGCSALLRSVGDAGRAMNVTLVGAVITACLDPVLILWLGLGLEGAAISTIFSRLGLAVIGWRSVTRTHDLVDAVHWRTIFSDAKEVLRIAAPAIVTNLASPVGAAFVTRTMSRFGTEAVAGQATIDRISPVAFALVFALSGSVGPIIAQNLGAGLFRRVRLVLRDSMLVGIGAVLVAWGILAAGQGLVVSAFSAHGTAEMMVRLFCSLVAGGYVFVGMLFVSNATFNNLGFPLMATVFNWGRATLGTIPFVAYGAAYGPRGVMIGQAAGSVVFGLAAAFAAWRATHRAPRRRARAMDVVAAPPASSGTSALASYAGQAEEE